MDEIGIASTIEHLKTQMGNIAEDIKEIKGMLSKKSIIDEQQNNSIAVMQHEVKDLQKQKNICSAEKTMSISNLRASASEQHDAINNITMKFDQHIKEEKAAQSKMRFQMGVWIPLLTTVLVFATDTILRVLHF